MIIRLSAYVISAGSDSVRLYLERNDSNFSIKSTYLQQKNAPFSTVLARWTSQQTDR
jgi:hypothetical protein